MGVAPAVWMVQFFCFLAELKFHRRVLRLKRFDITSAFRFTTRYIDDILAMANKFIEHLLSARDVYEGVRGIYRECLVLTTEQEKTDGEVTYLDLEIYKHTDLNHHTTVYNKKLHPPLDKIKHISYPHIESFISRTAKYGVMSSQLVRYARLCSRKESFVFHTRALLTTLLEKQYRFEKLAHTVRAFIFKHPYLFACRSPEGLAIACLKGLDPKEFARRG